MWIRRALSKRMQGVVAGMEDERGEGTQGCGGLRVGEKEEGKRSCSRHRTASTAWGKRKERRAYLRLSEAGQDHDEKRRQQKLHG